MPSGLRWILAILLVPFIASAAHAQTGMSTVTAVLGPTAPYFTDDVTASVTVTAAAAPVPTGTITWNTDTGGQQTASLSNGVARIDLSFFAPGAHTFNYSYSGDGTYAAVASQTSNFTVTDRAFTMYGSDHLVRPPGVSNIDYVAIDSQDNLIFTQQYQNNKLVRVDPKGVTTVIPTTGLNTPTNVVVDKQDDIFIADSGNARVVEITAAGTQSVLPITGLTSVTTLAFDPAYQSLYVVDQSAATIVIYNLAAQTQTSFSPGISPLTAVAVDPAGDVYYAQGANTVDNGHLYRRDTAGNVIEIFTETPGINGLSLDAKGDLYILSYGVFVLDPQGHLTELTPSGAYTTATAAPMDSRGRMYIPTGVNISLFTPGTSGDAGYSYLISGPVDPAFPLPGTGETVTLDYQAPYQQSFTNVAIANGALLQTPNYPPETGLTNSIASVPFVLQAYLDGYPALPGPWSTSVTITTTDGSTHINLVYGIGVAQNFAVTPGDITPGSPGVSSVGGVATDGNGNVYVSDPAANQVVQVSSTASTILPFAGLNAPTQLALDGLGAVFVLDSGSSRILRLDTAGNQTVAFDLSTQTALTSLSAFAMDGGDNLYIAGMTAGGQAAIYYVDTLGDQLLLTQNIPLPASLAFDGFGNLYGVETAGGNLRRYDQGITPTLVATGLTQPSSLAVDPSGTAFVAGPAGSGITIVHPDGTTIPYPSPALANASVITSDSQGNLVVGDNTGKQIFGMARVPGAHGQTFTYDFGNVPIGTTETYTGQLFNAGNAVTIPWGLSIFDSETSLATDSSECPGTQTGSDTPLAAGGYCDLNITFTPAYLGSMSENYIVVQRGYGTFLSVNVIGNGTAPIGAPTLTPNPLDFGSVTVNSTSQTGGIAVQNTSNQALAISSIAITGANAAEFSESSTCTSSLPANATCAIFVTFTPNAVGAATATVTVTDNATASTSTATIEGTGVAPAASASLSPTTLTFSNETVGVAGAAQTATLTNTGAADLGIASIAIGGANPTSFTQMNGCGSTLAAGANCTIQVVFDPTSAGSLGATLTVQFAGSSSTATIVHAHDTTVPAALTTTLSGTGVAAVANAPIATLTPTSLTYTATTGTTSPAQTATLTNSGTATLNISGITLTGANTSEFAISANTCSATLAVNASCTVSVTFSPDSVASFAAAISVADDASGSPQTSTLTGTGTAAPAAADFTVTATPATQSVTAGGAATFAIPVASTGGSFSDVVTLSATGLPPGATVSFSPATVTPRAAGAQSTMTVQTAAQQTASSRESSRWPLTGKLAAPVFAAFLLLIPGWRARKHWNAKVSRTFFTGAGCLLVLLGMMATITGCGAGFALPQTQTSATTYTITVTGTSGSVQHNTTVQITVR